jgi:arylsulfatase A-like enzyme
VYKRQGKAYPRPTTSTPPGWDDWQAWGGQGSRSYTLANNGNPVSYGPAEDDYLTDVLARKAVEFINAPDNRPFFIYVSTYAPHTEGYSIPVPAPRHAGAFAHLPLWRPPSYLEADASDKPAWIQELPIDFSILVALNDVIRIAQIEALQAVDEAIGRIVDAVEAKGESGNTVIIFTSDNGQTWGEHRLLFTKNAPYEESARVPLIIRYPRLAGAPRSAPELVTNVDLGPTIAAIAGIDPTGPVDGESLLPILIGQPATWRTDVLHEGWFPRHPAIGFASVRTEMWKYTEYGNGETELYDLVNDPHELESVAADPLHASTITSLRSRLQALRQ